MRRAFLSMKSMTGFGRSCADFKDFSITIDIASVNKKGLETSVSLPRDWSPMERTINAEIKKIFARGKFNIAISVEFKTSEADIFADEQTITKALNNLKSICEKNNIVFKPETASILEINKLILDKSQTSRIDWQEAWELICPVLAQACKNLNDMRSIEGDSLKIDLIARIEKIQHLVDCAQESAKSSPVKYKELLTQRLSALGLDINIEDERVLKEVCIFADRCDVSEEITRLKSHTAQFLEILESDDAVGRKLDFLCQEMGREINTTASKANNLELTKITLELKNEMERIREQVQNLE